MEMYRTTAPQRGNSFPSCAWRNILFRTRFSWFDHIFTTTASVLYHSRYGFWQVHFRHLVLHMRLLCNMIVDIHCDLCIWMFFAPLRSVLNGSPPDIQHPITYCITLGLTLFSPSLVHPVWRKVCDELGGIRFSSLCLRNAAYTICVIGMSLIPASVLVSESWKQYPSSPS